MAKTETPDDLKQRLGDGRQYGSSIAEIKKNHRSRYEWAADRLAGKVVVDAGCGVGYGSWILGEKCKRVTGLDFNVDLVAYATEKWGGRSNVDFKQSNIQSGILFPPADALVAFEVLEHLVSPESLLCSALKGSFLIGSVPNHDFAPHAIESNPFHIRHYTYPDLEDVLSNCGYQVTSWYHQDFAGEISLGKQEAKTIVFMAKRTSSLRPTNLESAVLDSLQFEFLRRCNVIKDIQNAKRKNTRGKTAF